MKIVPPPPPWQKQFLKCTAPLPTPSRPSLFLGIDFISCKIPVVSSVTSDFEGARREKVSAPKAPQT